jgi:hypothetical protein
MYVTMTRNDTTIEETLKEILLFFFNFYLFKKFEIFASTPY